MLGFMFQQQLTVEQHSDIDSQRLFRAANLQPIRRWTDSAQRYSLWLLERSPSIPSPSL